MYALETDKKKSRLCKKTQYKKEQEKKQQKEHLRQVARNHEEAPKQSGKAKFTSRVEKQ